MTFVIAKIVDHRAGRVMLLADTKITHRNDAKRTGHALVNPEQKVVIVNDDIVVGFAGDNPDNAKRAVVGLRGSTVDDVEAGLLDYTRSKASVKDASTSFCWLPEVRYRESWKSATGLSRTVQLSELAGSGTPPHTGHTQRRSSLCRICPT